MWSLIRLFQRKFEKCGRQNWKWVYDSRLHYQLWNSKVHQLHIWWELYSQSVTIDHINGIKQPIVEDHVDHIRINLRRWPLAHQVDRQNAFECMQPSWPVALIYRRLPGHWSTTNQSPTSNSTTLRIRPYKAPTTNNWMDLGDLVYEKNQGDYVFVLTTTWSFL